MTEVKFGYTILYVKNVQSSIEFYEKAFGFKRKFIAPKGEYGELLTGGTTLSFAKHSLAKSNLPDGFTESDPAAKPFGIEIAFTSPNVGEAFEYAISAGATVIERPVMKPHGQQVGYLRDPDGFLIELCSPME